VDYEREIEPFGPNEKCSDGAQLFGPDPPIFGFAPAAPMAPGRVLDPDGAACLNSSIAEPSPKVGCGVGSATLPPLGGYVGNAQRRSRVVVRNGFPGTGSRWMTVRLSDEGRQLAVQHGTDGFAQRIHRGDDRCRLVAAVCHAVSAALVTTAPVR
jgi:hypothetical protein